MNAALPPAREGAVPVLPEAVGKAGARALAAFHRHRRERRAMDDVLQDLAAIGGREIERGVDQLRHEMDRFAPAVTMIGQVKAGKTMLANALAGRPGLLPSDVNPWTSVVTSLHLNHPRPEGAPRAAFRFFDEGEWDRLMTNGGRIGELALRAGAEDEAEELRRQVAEMREKAMARLGRKFELMLGQTHHYEAFDEALVKRYVCMGDEYDERAQREGQGRFADITRSADLWLDAPFMPVPLTIRDTPGVNDTFMMREQITVKALRDSRTCVVVLSAHQALNTTDMGLIRLISNMRSRDVILFVNRIDELSDPAAQIPEIEASLTATLADRIEGETPEIVFGSAYWAEAVLSGTADGLDAASARALAALAEGRAAGGPPAPQGPELVWALSGLPALFEGIGRRLEDGPWQTALDRAASRAGNHVMNLRALSSRATLREEGAATREDIPAGEAARLLDAAEATALDAMSAGLDGILAKFESRVEQVHESFLDRALAELLGHLEERGEGAVWSYSPDGLRLLIRSAHHVMRRRVLKAAEGACFDLAGELAALQARIFAIEADDFALMVPPMADLPQPIMLAQTIALDLKTSWWKSWWGRRRGYDAFAADFRELIAAETAPIVEELTGAHLSEIRRMAEAHLRDFAADHKRTITALREKADIGVDELNELFGVSAARERDRLLDLVMEDLGLEDPKYREEADA
ncbi:MAG: dynamin family protein [Hasllibacter sp.]